MFGSPSVKNTFSFQTQIMDSETYGVQWKQDFNSSFAMSGAWRAEIPKVVTRIITVSNTQVPLPVPQWLSTIGYTFFSRCHLNFLLHCFKICLSWDWQDSRSGSLSGTFLHLWWEALVVIVLSSPYTVFTDFIILGWFSLLTLSSLTKWTNSNKHKLIHRKWPELNILP
jgi:hypothetical protein